ncbi:MULTISPECIES: hypothetical protein [Pseudomonas]|uniref:hypothetical protein n=1 Tax=Pseudomonas sp. MIL9 TaxID=2807620 RepID=UPI0019505D3E|nr:hypothetical protein [Pseudomonas sp. MIL9]MBM6447238.1 hypothetical protein [Pseudomonas sp. MIL9]
MAKLILAARTKYRHLLLPSANEPSSAVTELVKAFRHREKSLAAMATFVALLLALLV